MLTNEFGNVRDFTYMELGDSHDWRSIYRELVKCRGRIEFVEPSVIGLYRTFIELLLSECNDINVKSVIDFIINADTGLVLKRATELYLFNGSLVFCYDLSKNDFCLGIDSKWKFIGNAWDGHN